MNSIYFYHVNEVPYGCFSNFSAHPITIDGKSYPTSEHYFQAMKFEGTSHAEDVCQAIKPGDAAQIGRDRKRPLRKDWEHIKDDVMRKAVLAKFRQHPDICKVLLSSGESEIIEKTTNDYYWGCGTSGEGKNMLGKILVEIRDILRHEGK